MTDPSDSPVVQVKNGLSSEPIVAADEVFPIKEPQLQQPDMDKQNSESMNQSEAVESEDGDIHTISGEKPFFDLILAKSHVNTTPSHNKSGAASCHGPVVLRSGCKNWDLEYVGNCDHPRFDRRWKNFVADNDLEAGDACVFELMECSNELIKFNVVILKNSLPPELLETVDCRGSEYNPISIE